MFYISDFEIQVAFKILQSTNRPIPLELGYFAFTFLEFYWLNKFLNAQKLVMYEKFEQKYLGIFTLIRNAQI